MDTITAELPVTRTNLTMLRVILFAFMQRAEGEQLRDFWALIDDVEQCREAFPPPADAPHAISMLALSVGDDPPFMYQAQCRCDWKSDETNDRAVAAASGTQHLAARREHPVPPIEVIDRSELTANERRLADIPLRDD